MKYRIFALMSLLALGVGSLMAQDYDDIYYDASKSSSSKGKTVKVVKPVKTVQVYGEVPEKYKEAVQSNYSTDRDVDEYNRRGAYEPNYEVTITGDTVFYGDTIYEEAFANTRRIERFYNPDIVILSDDEDLVELYYDESPTINLIVGSDWGYGSYYGYGWSSYYPWYTDWYYPWYSGWYGPWYRPWHYSPWYWGYTPWYYSSWHWGWNHHYWSGWHGWDWYGHYTTPVRHPNRFVDTSARPGGHRGGLATNRNTRGRVDVGASNRNGISARGANESRSAGVGNIGSRSRGGYASTRGGGNMGSRSSSGVTTRRSSATGGYSSGSRSSGGYSPSGRSSSSYGGSRSNSSTSRGSYGGSSSRGSSGGGSYSSGGGGSHGSSGGGGGHSGSSGGGGRRH